MRVCGYFGIRNSTLKRKGEWISLKQWEIHYFLYQSHQEQHPFKRVTSGLHLINIWYIVWFYSIANNTTRCASYQEAINQTKYSRCIWLWCLQSSLSAISTMGKAGSPRPAKHAWWQLCYFIETESSNVFVFLCKNQSWPERAILI